MSPFKVVYGFDPLSSLDLVPRAMNEKSSVEARKRVEEIQKLHELVTKKIEKANASYRNQANRYKRRGKVQPEDLVCIYLRTKHFSSKHKTK